MRRFVKAIQHERIDRNPNKYRFIVPCPWDKVLPRFRPTLNMLQAQTNAFKVPVRIKSLSDCCVRAPCRISLREIRSLVRCALMRIGSSFGFSRRNRTKLSAVKAMKTDTIKRANIRRT